MLERIGPAIAVIWHGTYEAAGAGVDNLPGGKGWRAEIERFPEASRHLHVHEGHLVELTERDRRNLAPELAGATFSGTPAQLRERAAGLDAQGVGEIVYWPMGPDLAGELEGMRRALASGPQARRRRSFHSRGRDRRVWRERWQGGSTRAARARTRSARSARR